jgi:CDP-glucose 4,6-dehydratase
MASLWGPSAKWEIDNSTHPHEANFLKLDISKARSRLNWSPQIRISEALSLIIDWTKKFHGGANMHNLTLSQINQYQSLIQKSK